MKTQKIQRIYFIWMIGYLILIGGITGCVGLFSSHSIEIEEGSQEDVVLAMQIKAKLIEAKELNAAAIQVESTKGLVVLRGFVETESQRQLASSITQKTPNVKRVDNQIKVK